MKAFQVERYGDKDGLRAGDVANVVVGYREQAFETVSHDYDVVLDSPGGETLVNSPRVLKPGGKIISVPGPPDAAFAREPGAHPIIGLAMSAPGFRTRRRYRRQHATDRCLFMRAGGSQLRELTHLIEAGNVPSSAPSSPASRPGKHWSISRQGGPGQARPW
ncbi:zinc-binding dehydrogenase [Streptomyces sp. NPDC127079]|uniref:zinc-binding dehydrogenase n=1 Tax=Streptomyces sp. NPDC127079 TaxID=3347132 RepID=UPI00366320CB